MAALVTIGGFEFPEPSTYNATTSTIVDSARNIQGKAVGGDMTYSKHICFFTKFFVGWESLEDYPTRTNFKICKEKPYSIWT